MRPGEGDQRLLGGLAKTLKICNMDPGALGTVRFISRVLLYSTSGFRKWL
jgi:hypothetical protein